MPFPRLQYSRTTWRLCCVQVGVLSRHKRLGEQSQASLFGGVTSDSSLVDGSCGTWRNVAQAAEVWLECLPLPSFPDCHQKRREINIKCEKPLAIRCGTAHTPCTTLLLTHTYTCMHALTCPHAYAHTYSCTHVLMHVCTHTHC